MYSLHFGYPDTMMTQKDTKKYMCITINEIESCTDTPNCMIAEEIMEATIENECLSVLAELVLYGWPTTSTEMQKELQAHCSPKDEIAIINGITIKVRTIIPASVQKRQQINCISIIWE